MDTHFQGDPLTADLKGVHIFRSTSTSTSLVKISTSTMAPQQESGESTTGNENENVRKRLPRRELTSQKAQELHEDQLKCLSIILGIRGSDHLSRLFPTAPDSAKTVGDLSLEILRMVTHWAVIRYELDGDFSASSFLEELNEFEESTDKFKPWAPYGTASSGLCRGHTAIKEKLKTVRAEMAEKMTAKGFNGPFMVKNARRQFSKKQGLHQSAGRKRKRGEEDNEDGDEVQPVSVASELGIQALISQRRLDQRRSRPRY
jgi:hypothetical protein